MGKFISILIAIGAIAFLLIAGGAFYIVNESEQVVITPVSYTHLTLPTNREV